MTSGDWISIVAIALTAIGIIVPGVYYLSSVHSKVKTSDESLVKLTDTVNNIRLSQKEHSVKISYLEHTAEKLDGRLTYIEKSN